MPLRILMVMVLALAQTNAFRSLVSPRALFSHHVQADEEHIACCPLCEIGSLNDNDFSCGCGCGVSDSPMPPSSDLDPIIIVTNDRFESLLTSFDVEVSMIVADPVWIDASSSASSKVVDDRVSVIDGDGSVGGVLAALGQWVI